ncbi:DUF6731 family protein [Acidovorax sp.]|uniref:DUF6731 family protein n=1 Tax=Acidovorax sp. TaxID=1872122 RepID=UPI0025BCA346|nr:DUF6731 family protein [Acidovorax sp.]
MTRKVTVNLFDVGWTERKTQKLSATLEEFAQLPIEDRWRGDIRLDRVERVAGDAALPVDAFHLDFAKSRDIGPGKISPHAVISDVGLRREEFFGEETAAIYIPKKRWLCVLHNQYGTGPSRIAEYLNALDPGSNNRRFDYEVVPKIDARALQRMQGMKHLSEVTVSANVGAFEDANDDVGESVKEAATAARAMRLHLKLVANPAHKRGGFLDLGVVRKLVDSMLKQPDDVDRLEVKGGGGAAEEKDQMINLLKHKIRKQFPDTSLIVANHRYTFESKIHLLRSPCRMWIDSLD